MRPTLLLLLLALPAFTADRQVAITIDDLPRGGDGGTLSAAELRSMTKRLLEPFRKDHIPVIGFVNQGRGSLGEKDLRGILDLWLDAGADLGNHSHSHLNINQVPLADYEADILRGEPVLRAALSARGKRLEYYRHPFLYKGPTAEIKTHLEAFLKEHGYREAPVTLDNADYAFAARFTDPHYRARVEREYVPYMRSIVEFFESRSVEMEGREIPQILLIHANELNAQKIPELLAMFRARGYRFVSLAEALKDDAYRQPESYVGKGGFSWFHRWSKTRGIPARGEPDAPSWVETN